jgi:intracellular septation protein A
VADDGLSGVIGRAERQQVSVRALLLGTGPRFARDAFGPVAAFYLGWKLATLATGIIAATAVTVIAYLWERRHARTGVTAAMGLAIALAQAFVGLASGSAKWYLAPPVIVNAVYGVAFLVSVLIGRPLAGVFASETYPFPPLVRQSATFRRVFGRVSLAWAAYLLGRSLLRLVALLRASVEVFIVVNIVTGIPFTAALMAWSIWYGVRGFRRSAEWGPYLAAGEGPAPVPDADVAPAAPGPGKTLPP